MNITSDTACEILDLRVRGASRYGCLEQGDRLAVQYFGSEEWVKRFVCSVEVYAEGFDHHVTMWEMHLYYRRTTDGKSPFPDTARQS